MTRIVLLVAVSMALFACGPMPTDEITDAGVGSAVDAGAVIDAGAAPDSGCDVQHRFSCCPPPPTDGGKPIPCAI